MEELALRFAIANSRLMKLNIHNSETWNTLAEMSHYEFKVNQSRRKKRKKFSNSIKKFALKLQNYRKKNIRKWPRKQNPQRASKCLGHLKKNTGHRRERKWKMQIEQLHN